MTQHEVGQACGVSFQQIQKYEAAVTKLSASKLWELSKVLQVNVSYFYDGLDLDRAIPGIETSRPVRTLAFESL